MARIAKVTDPKKVVTDHVLLKELQRRKIDRNYVEFVQDYAPRYVNGKRVKERSPHAKFYRDLKSNKRFMVVSELPMVTADGDKIEPGWEYADGRYNSRLNLFDAQVEGNHVQVTVLSDQPDGRKAGDRLAYEPEVYLAGAKLDYLAGPNLIDDPLNPNYQANVIEWDYGVVKRRLRIIEGLIIGYWIEGSKPTGTLRFKYNQSGDYRLKLSGYAINEDEEEVTPAQVEMLSMIEPGYPVAIGDQSIFYPDADPESTSVDGFTTRGTANEIWYNKLYLTGTHAYDTVTNGIRILIYCDTQTNSFAHLSRSIILFDTSALPDSASISDAVLSLYGASKSDGMSLSPELSINIYSSNPNTNTALIPADHLSLGTQAFCDTPVGYTAFTTSDYNDFTLNTNGKNAISKTGVTKYGIRETYYDVAHMTPSWVQLQYTSMYSYAAEQGAGYKPKLVVTYESYTVPALTTEAPTDVYYEGATGNGTITNTGGLTVTKRGFCWNKTGSPTVADEHTEEEGSYGTGAFDLPISGLDTETHYYIKAYAYNAQGYGYGDEEEFDTTVDPDVWTCPAVGNTRATAVTGCGDINNVDFITQIGFQYKLHSEPEYGDAVYLADVPPDPAFFYAEITGLEHETIYDYRAFAYHSIVGWLYGDTESFVTAAPIPVVRTDPPSDADLYHFDAEGEIEDCGGDATCDIRGFVYGLTSFYANPGDVTPEASGYEYHKEEEGAYPAEAFGLTIDENLGPSRVYYVRAYAHNSYGYTYGGEIEVITSETTEALYLSANHTIGIRFDTSPGGGSVPYGGSVPHYRILRHFDSQLNAGGIWGYLSGNFIFEQNYYNDNYYSDLFHLSDPMWHDREIELAEGIDDSQTEFDVNDASEIEVGMRLKIDSEDDILIDDIDDVTLTVTRGSSPASHDNGATVYFREENIVKIKWKAHTLKSTYPYGKRKRLLRTHSTTYTGAEAYCGTTQELICEIFPKNLFTTEDWTLDEADNLVFGIALGAGGSYGFPACDYLTGRLCRANAEVRADGSERLNATTVRFFATLLEDEGEECEVYFEYGPTVGYGSETDPQTGILVNGEFQADVTTAGDIHFRAVVVTACGETFYSADMVAPDYIGDVFFISKCLAVHIERGWDEELQQATTGLAEFVVDNANGDFNPENEGGAFYGQIVLGAELAFVERYKGVDYLLFTGKIDKILPNDDPDDLTAYIRAVDGMDDLAATKVSTVLRQDTDVGELAEDVLDAAGWDAGKRDIDAGVDTLEFGWFHKRSGLEALRDLEMTEKGRFFVKVDGTARFENRHYRITGDGLVSQASFLDTAVRIEYEWTKRLLYNEVLVTGRRYFAGGVQLFSGYDMAELEDALIWSAHAGDTAAPYIPQATTIVIWAEFNSPLSSYTSLEKGTHWNANTEADKTGIDVSDNITISETQYGQAVKLEIENTGTVGAYLVEPDSPPLGAPEERTLLLYGVLFSAENLTFMEEDTDSQSNYGKRTLEVDAPFKSSPNQILAYTQWLLGRYHIPIPVPIQIIHVGRTNWPDDTIKIQTLTRDISDRITVRSTKLGFDRDFYINKVIHDYAMNEGGTVSEHSWIVERAEGSAEGLYWLLEIPDFGELEETTRLGF